MRILIMLAALAVASPAHAVPERTLQQARTIYDQLRDRTQCPAALPVAREFWHSPEFSMLADNIRLVMLREMMNCAWRQGDADTAIGVTNDSRAAGADWAYYALLQLGIRFERDDVSLEGFNGMAERDRETLASMPWRFAWGALRAANDIDPSGAQALRVHDVLASLPYAPEEGGFDDGLRMDHALLLLAAGQTDRARARLSTIVDPRQIMIIRVDNRFDALRQDAEFSRRLDVHAAAEADLTRSRVRAETERTNLHAFLEVAQALRSLGRHREALALLEQHIARAQSAGGGGYEDVSDSLNWLQNERAYILYDLDRASEARDAFGLSIAAGEGGEWSVSQVINFASMLISEQRPRDALEVLRTVGNASPYGDMWVAATRACAAAQMGDAALQETALTFLREHTEDNVAAMARSYLCVNDLDAAAALYIQRLGNIEQRSGALLALQRHRPESGVSLPYNAILRERLDRVRARADVQAAVAAVGRIEDVPLQNVYWGDI